MTVAPFGYDSLILTNAPGRHADDRRSLIRGAELGQLIRLRRGAYVEASHWNGCTALEKHLLRIRAADAAADAPIVVARESAAAVWGTPIAGPYPEHVTVLVEWPGGGSSEADIKRTADGFRSAEVVHVDGVRTTSLARTALDVARFVPFANAVGSIDWSLWRRNPLAVDRAELVTDFERWRPRVGRRMLRRAIPFATPLSDSFGESQTRAVIEQLGFARPRQQVEFSDGEGLIVTDFHWTDANVAAEFDGKVKYISDEYSGGNPAEVVWREKLREDRLRRHVNTVIRIVRADVAHPERLARLLLAAGIPRGGG